MDRAFFDAIAYSRINKRIVSPSPYLAVNGGDKMSPLYMQNFERHGVELAHDIVVIEPEYDIGSPIVQAQSDALKELDRVSPRKKC